MEAALRAAQLAVAHDQAGEFGRAATQYAAAAGLLRKLAKAAPPEQAPAFVSRAAEYEGRATALRELDAIASLPPPPSSTVRPTAAAASQPSGADLQARLDRLKAGGGAAAAPPATDQELQARFSRLAGEPAPELQPEPEPEQAPTMTADEARQYERDQLAALGLGSGGGSGAGGLTEVGQLLAQAVADNKMSHLSGDRIPDEDGDDEMGGLSALMAQARDAARLEAKYGTAAPTVAGGAAAGAASEPRDHHHSSDNEEDDVDASLKRWLRSLDLGQYIDAVAAFAHDMEEAGWITKDQVAVMPMSAQEKERLRVGIARLPTSD